MTSGLQQRWKPDNERGVGMLEVLITLFIMSVGLLGLAAMQTTSLKDSGDAIQRSKAVLFVADIIDRMRANPAGMDDYAVTPTQNVSGWAANNCIDSYSDQHDTNSGTAANCSAQQMARYDVYLWKEALNPSVTEEKGSGLPNGQGSIQAVAGVTGAFTITVQWSPRKDETVGTVDDGSGTTRVYQYSTQVQF